MLLVLAPLASLSLAGQEHGRTIPLADIGQASESHVATFALSHLSAVQREAADMKRREFITVLGGAAAHGRWPRVRSSPSAYGASACCCPEPRATVEFQTRVAAFQQGLQQAGWTIGRNVRIDTRWATTDAAEIRRHAAELAALAPDVILAQGTSSVGPLLQATRAVPIVFVIVVDPVGAGFVASLARPGGNATGFMQFEYSLSAKWLELLKEIAPGVTRVAVLRDHTIASGIGQFGAIQSAAPSLRMEAIPINVRDAGEIELAIAAFARSSNGGLIVTSGPLAQRRMRSDRHASSPSPIARDLLRSAIRRWGRPDLLRDESGRSIPARGRLRRSHPQGREAG